MHLPNISTPFYAKHRDGRYENFDLSNTSEPITEANYREYINTVESRRTPMPIDPEPELANNLPAAQWPRAPPFGQPHIDAFTGIPFKNNYRPAYNPYRNSIQDDEMDVPLLGDYDTEDEEVHATHTSDRSIALKFIDKIRSAADACKGKMLSGANTRWSNERASYRKLESGADSLPQATSPISNSSSKTPSLTSRIRDTIQKPRSPTTAASTVSFARTRRSKSGQLWDRARSRSRSPSLSPTLTSESNSIKSTSTTSDGKPKTDLLPSTNPDYDPTIRNLLLLQQQGLTFRQIKTLCEFEESEDELYAVFWKAVASGETFKLADERQC